MSLTSCVSELTWVVGQLSTILTGTNQVAKSVQGVMGTNGTDIKHIFADFDTTTAMYIEGGLAVVTVLAGGYHVVRAYCYQPPQ